LDALELETAGRRASGSEL